MAPRFGTATFWIVAGALHFVIPRQYEAIVPPRIARWKRELVVTSGVAPRSRRSRSGAACPCSSCSAG